MMQYVGRYYVPYINHKYGKSGSLWEGRYKASLVDAEHYLLLCMRYIELNPVAADMVKTVLHYPWSSFRQNALVTPHTLFDAFIAGDEQERTAYNAFFQLIKLIL